MYPSFHYCIIAIIGIVNIPVLGTSVTLAQSERALEVRQEVSPQSPPNDQMPQRDTPPAANSNTPLPEQASENARQQQQNNTQSNKNIRLEKEKLKACQNRERTITNTMARMSDRSTKQLELFTTISERAQTYYRDNNLSIDTYDALMNKVNTQRLLAEDAVAATQEASFGFDCESMNPKEMTMSFKQQLQTQNTLLQKYRQAIKDLIVAIRSSHAVTKEAHND